MMVRPQSGQIGRGGRSPRCRWRWRLTRMKVGSDMGSAGGADQVVMRRITSTSSIAVGSAVAFAPVDVIGSPNESPVGLQEGAEDVVGGGGWHGGIAVG